MKNKTFVTDYHRVVKVLNSCNTDAQISVAENYFNLFLKKWSDKLTEQNYLTMVYHYTNLKNDKMLNFFKLKK